MSVGHVIVLVLLWAGVACFLLSAFALVRLRGTLMRLHALAAASCLGLPLIAVAVAVEQGAGRAALKTLMIGLLFAAGGTAGTIAVGKAAAQAGERGGPGRRSQPGAPGGPRGSDAGGGQ